MTYINKTVEYFKNLPTWTKAGVGFLVAGFLLGRLSVPTNTIKEKEQISQTTQKEQTNKSETSSDSTSKNTETSRTRTEGPIKIVRKETKPDGTKINEVIVVGPIKDTTSTKESNNSSSQNTKNESTNKESSTTTITKEVVITQPFPTYSVGVFVKTKTKDLLLNQLEKEIGLSGGYRVFKGLWVEGVFSGTTNFKDPSVGLGLKVEF